MVGISTINGTDGSSLALLGCNVTHHHSSGSYYY